MHLVVGLGNPGARYADTRHNIGARVIDSAAARWAVTLKQSDQARMGTGRVGTASLALAVPLSWMNESGPVVSALLTKHALSPAELIVVHDDLDLPLGRLRIKVKGGPGGHNGLRSIIAELGSEDFVRVKLGIGRPPAGIDSADYVLASFLAEERETVDGLCVRAVDAVECVLREGIEPAMNRFNIRPKQDEESGAPESE